MAPLSRTLLTMSSLGWLRAVLTGGLLAALVASACATEVVSKAPVGVGGSADGSHAGGGGSGGATVVRRTVLTRNPFGNVGVTDNLLWDGDFEWLSSFSDQYGWLTGQHDSAIGYDLPKPLLGAACKSGVKCIALKKDGIAVALGVASVGHPLEASLSVWTEEDCGNVEVALVGYDNTEPDVALTSEGRVDGWCRYHAVAAERKRAAALYIHNGTATSIRVDDAVVRRAETAAGQQVAPRSLRDFSALKRELKRRTKPNPRPRPANEQAWLRELARRGKQ